MTDLTRRLDPDRQDCGQVWYGDIPAGSIARAVGAPGNTEMWHWRLLPRAADRVNAPAVQRAAFGAEWDAFLKSRTEADFAAWHHHKAWTAEKYRRFDRGERMDLRWNPSAEEQAEQRLQREVRADVSDDRCHKAVAPVEITPQP